MFFYVYYATGVVNQDEYSVQGCLKILRKRHTSFILRYTCIP